MPGHEFSCRSLSSRKRLWRVPDRLVYRAIQRGRGAKGTSALGPRLMGRGQTMTEIKSEYLYVGGGGN